jgi:hypothetical protein
MEPNNPRIDRDWLSTNRLLPAAVMIGIGVLFLLRNLHLLHNFNPFDFWPVILIVIGAVKLIEAPQSGSFVGPAVLLGIGGLFLAANLGLLPVDSIWDLWPVALIGIGIFLLLERISWRDHISNHVRGQWPVGGQGTWSSGSSDLNLVAVFSGGKHKVTGDFRGGVISAVFGGYEVDLRDATMQGNSVVLKADAVFGGVELKIPQDWLAVVQGAAIFGGYTDETRRPPLTPDTKRLIVKGGAVFGGVVVKN